MENLEAKKQSLIARREEVLANLKERMSRQYRGPGGAEEYDDADYEAAQENERRKEELRQELSELNEQLGIEE